MRTARYVCREDQRECGAAGAVYSVRDTQKSRGEPAALYESYAVI